MAAARCACVMVAAQVVAAATFLGQAPIDFDALKVSVTGGESFKQKVSAACTGSNLADCEQKKSDSMFCALLSRKKPQLAAEHCGDNAGLKFLTEKAKEAGVVKLPSGLMYKVLQHGAGKFHPAPDSPCLCDYEGTLVDGTEFDSSYNRGHPSTFAPEQVIAGWTEAMQLMVEGDKWELYIPSSLGYGEQGAGADIPAGAALVFQMELHEIQGNKLPSA